MPTLLIEHGTVICVDERRRIIDNGVVLIRDDRIEFVGERDAMPSGVAIDQTLDARRMAVLPGFIDCHAHAGHGLVKTLGADQCARLHVPRLTVDHRHIGIGPLCRPGQVGAGRMREHHVPPHPVRFDDVEHVIDDVIHAGIDGR